MYIDRRFWISIYVNTNTNRVERKIGVSPRINRLDPHLFRETFFFFFNSMMEKILIEVTNKVIRIIYRSKRNCKNNWK